jgi:hypothetical protein
MQLFLDQLRNEFTATAFMLQKVIKECPDTLWKEKFGEFFFHEECFHCLVYLDVVTSSWKPFQEERFGNPRHRIVDKIYWTKKNLIDYLNTTIRMNEAAFTEKAFKTMKKECPDFKPEKEIQGALQVLRHAQHHIGKLTAYLNTKEVKFQDWK